MAIRPFLAVLTCAALAGCGTGPTPGAPSETPATTPPASEPASAPPVTKPVATKITYPAHGHQKWQTAPAQSNAAAGRGGNLLRYRIQIETDIKGLAPATFARTVAGTLGDPRGWTAGGKRRFRQVGPGQPYDFTIYLATPATRDELCDDTPDGYTSCRNGDTVVLNVARWVKGVPGYGASLDTYREYMVNHEVGHRLGNGHQRCPGEGQPAPVMQQQTLGLHGCEPNPWPYVDGKLYAGRSGVYDDDLPPRDKGNA